MPHGSAFFQLSTLACSYSVLIIHLAFLAFLQLKSLSLSSGNSVDPQGILLCDY